MRDILIIIVLLMVMLAPGLVNLAILRFLLKAWWNRKILRRCVLWLAPIHLVLALMMGLTLYLLPREFSPGLGFEVRILQILQALVVGIFLIQATLVPGLSIASLISAASRRSSKSQSTTNPMIPSRRRFLQGLAGSVPVVAGTTAFAGVSRSYQTANVYKLTISLQDLPAGLIGTKICHISDLHLWDLWSLTDLDHALQKVAEFEPEIVVVTGDVADDKKLLPGALRQIESLEPHLGTYAVLGNHEYAHDLTQITQIFAESNTTLLRNENRTLIRYGTKLQIVGLDDLKGKTDRRESINDYYKRCLAKSTSNMDSGQTLIISHRPDVFDAIGDSQSSLTLAGHTHGGQIALAGHSILELLKERYKYPLGRYSRNKAELFTTTGGGQWFPFRLGCPPEIVIIELASG